MQEIAVIRATRRFLQQRGLLGARALDLFTDAHPTLLGAADLRPFQRFTLAFDGFAVHPDAVELLDLPRVRLSGRRECRHTPEPLHHLAACTAPERVWPPAQGVASARSFSVRSCETRLRHL